MKTPYFSDEIDIMEGSLIVKTDDQRMTPKLSIIVPVYNAEKYLRDCLESIENSYFTDFIVLLVDDGSTDSSGKICDAFTQKDPRFLTFHRSNKGVSAARNFGIELTETPFIMFVDSDDLIEPDYIEKTIINGSEDYSFSGYKNYDEGTIREADVTQNRVFPIEELQKEVEQTGGLVRPTFVWSGCYRTSIIKNNRLFFDETCNLGEDVLFNIGYLEHCKIIRENSSSGYIHRKVKNSLVHRYYTNRLEKEETECRATERFIGHENMRGRFFGWHAAITHFELWNARGDKEVSKDARMRLKETYKRAYFRKSLPFIRKTGSLDEKIETYFMNYYLHWIYAVLLKKYLRKERRQ